jgi:LAO/AO transport system kinase
VVVEAPGFGDEVQAIKAGILEIADLLVVNKADTPGVERTVKALEMMLELRQGNSRRVSHHGQMSLMEMTATVMPVASWVIPMQKTVATNGEGVNDVHQQIEAHRTWLIESGEWAVRERRRIANTLEQIIHTEINRRVLAQLSSERLDAVVEDIRLRMIDPYSASAAILATL